MRIIILTLALALFGLTSAASSAAESKNHFAKGTKSYQKSAPAADEASQATDDQTSATNENPQDISPAAGAEDDSAPPPRETLREDMQLPRK